MKKYMKPTTEVILLATNQAFMTGSVEAKITGEQGNDKALSRRYSGAWEEEELEEEEEEF